MKKFFTMMILVLAVALAMAQVPEKFSYQAVVRNASNALVTNAPVGVRVSVLQGGVNGTLVYMETHTAVTNANGLMTLQIGGGNVQQGSFADIDWANGTYFLKTEIDPAGGTNYSITTTQQLLSVPYALYAKEAGNGFSGDYNDLTNVPQIPQIPADVSAFNNDAGYLTNYTETDPQYNAWNKDYNDLINKPTIPTVPTNVSAFTNDAGYLTNYTETDPQFNAWDKDYNDLINKPVIPTVPTNVSAFTNDANYVTTSQLNAANYITAAQIPTQVNADWNATTGVALILNKPTLFSGNYNDLTNKPTLFDGNYNSLSNRPNLAAVATSGNYNDLINKPSIPTAVGELTNNVGYITLSQVPAQVNADWNATTGAAQILNKPALFSGDYNDLTNKPTIFSGNYNDLTNKPTIPIVPTDISAFYNDAHYVTEVELNAFLTAMNNAIDSLKNRIAELENGGVPVNPDSATIDTTVTPGASFNIDGLACPGTATVTDKDGNLYNTVAIGQQCWLKENLRTTHYADGTPIPLGTTASSTVSYRYNPGGEASNLYTYGFVYNWSAVMNGSQSSNANPSNVRGVCPMGWHVPSNQEWSQLTAYVSSKTDNRCGGNAQNIAKALASTSNWSSNSISCTVGDYAPNNNATGFSALPAGDISGNIGTYANFWSCTQSDNSTAYALQLASTSTVVTVNAEADKSNGYSVRCVRDSAIATGSAQMVVTGDVESITTTSVSCGGTVNSGSGLVVTARGVCWSQMPNPTKEGSHTDCGSGMGTFIGSVIGLQPGTTYYIRAYATTELGTAYGYTQVFTTLNDTSACGTSTIYDYDGHTYNTVKIGDQCWMKENLRTTHYADGTTISMGYISSSTDAYYYVTNGTSEYGLLYNRVAVMHGVSNSSNNPSNVRGICPVGWHVPSVAEWLQLTQYVGGQSQYCCANDMTYIAKALASKTGWSTSTNTCAVGNEPSANNATGFGALPAGSFYETGGGIQQFGEAAFFWGTDGVRNLYSWRAIVTSYAGVANINGYSVRCLRD